MKEYFPKDCYVTPDNVNPYKGDILFLKTRIYFFLLLAKRIIVSSITKARRGLYDNEYWAKSSFDTLRDLEGCGVSFNISGIDNIRNVKGPCVFIANHMSNLETFVLPSIILSYKSSAFVIKSSLTHIPFFGSIMKATSSISIGRKNPSEDLQTVLIEGENKLKRGISVIIFPQGTRQTFFDKKKFNSLGVKVARRSNVPIIPIALKTDTLSNGKIFKDFGKLKREKTVYFKFGSPLKIQGNGKEEHETVTEFISSSLKEWGVPLA